MKLPPPASTASGSNIRDETRTYAREDDGGETEERARTGGVPVETPHSDRLITW